MISCVIKRALLSVMILFCPILVFGQKTSYYRLVSCSDASVAINGGQFVTFAGNTCFESDSKGISVENGKLTRNQYVSTDSERVYEGTAFVGDNAKFVFNEDKSRLKVVSKNGNKYNFERAIAPSGVTTSSFIRQSGNSTVVYQDSYQPSMPIQNQAVGNSSPNTSSSTSGSTSTPRSTPKRHTCPRCNGNKRVELNTYPAMYGQQDYQKTCHECNRSFPASWGHTHVSCPQCHGRGYFTTD